MSNALYTIKVVSAYYSRTMFPPSRCPSTNYLLNIDLESRRRLMPLNPAGHIDPLTVTRYLDQVVQVRLLYVYFCTPCFNARESTPARCRCTLRSRFLERWLCIGCADHEQHEDEDLFGVNNPLYGGSICPCGKEMDWVNSASYKIICRWCKGEVLPEIEAGFIVPAVREDGE